MKLNYGYIPHKNRKVDILTKLIGWPHLVRRMQVPILNKMFDLHESDIFLDLGCGAGNLVYEYSKICRCVGVDLNQSTSRNTAFSQKYQQNLNFAVADGLNLPFKDNTFDNFFLTVLHLVNDKEILLKECYRVLRENGLLIQPILREYSGIKRIYNKKLFKLAIKVFNLPPTYSAFEKGDLNKACMIRCYNEKEVVELLEKNSFKVIELQHVPKVFGALISDMILVLSYCFKIPSSHPLYFPILYPFSYLIDKLSNKKSKGNEFVIKAKKIGTHK